MSKQDSTARRNKKGEPDKTPVERWYGAPPISIATKHERAVERMGYHLLEYSICLEYGFARRSEFHKRLIDFYAKQILKFEAHLKK